MVMCVGLFTLSVLASDHFEYLMYEYYYNRTTGVVRWRRLDEHPLASNLWLQLKDHVVMLQNELTTSAQPSTHLPLGWTQHQDDDDQTYYVNRTTCNSKWERPGEPPYSFEPRAPGRVTKRPSGDVAK